MNEDNKNDRVEQQLQHLPPTRRHTLNSANPLTGLNQNDVQTFLEGAKPKSAPEVTPAVQEHVWNASSVNLEGKFADPFFLRFVLDGVERRRSFYIAWKPFHIHWMMHSKFCGFPYPMIWTFCVTVCC